ncbi:NADP-dependent oxidoreductase [Lacisediminihabitans profunda]|uniref:NADP-dependent oxidoreductase n=1 Tax=Lacisediminihabitans profunda TaxID=2594790 RepID=A0A5C8UWZ2_9MICO|nr:NADP-dependent oxidoreductase [Lacisediminihabitans profunda]TXN32117.1 NADP-dependent oxidoreductase [Lacisediminihabitans profunda]
MAIIVQYSRFGGPEVLEVVEVPTPTAPVDGVVVEVRAAGVNPIDSKLRSGLRSSAPLTGPRRVGSDAAGVIVETGALVDGWSVGDEVIVRGADGAYASHLVAYPRQLVAKPKSLSWEQAAAIGVPAGTAFQVLTSLGVTRGDTLLVHGGSGAVGQAAVQFAHAWGATVVATASEANHARLAELGAIPVAYGPGLTDRVRAVAPQGIDVALDAAGTPEAIETSLALVADHNRIGTIVLGAKAAELGIRAWSGGSPVPLTAQEQALRREAIDAVAELVRRGEFQIEISRRLPLSAAAEAQRESETGHVRGKIVLLPGV